MREKVLRYIRDKGLLKAGDRVVVAVSGGADSVALLRQLLDLRADLGVVLAVAHFNHGLRGDSAQADEAFVAELAKQHAVEFFGAREDVREHAFRNKLSIEAAARELRYRWLTQLAAEQRFDAIATAHTADDQAETVLLKFLRGAGTRGLAGIYPVVRANTARAKDHLAPEFPDDTARESNPEVRIVRPLLQISRADVESYLASIDQPWREDESNLDRRFLRNRVRHDLLPLLEREYNPNLRARLASLAEVSRAEEEYWQDAVSREVEVRKSGPRQLVLAGFPRLPLALQRRLLRAFAQSAGLTLDFEHLESLLACSLGQTGPDGGSRRLAGREKTRLPGASAAGTFAGGGIRMSALDSRRSSHCGARHHRSGCARSRRVRSRVGKRHPA